MNDHICSSIIHMLSTSSSRLTPSQIYERLNIPVPRRDFMKKIKQMVIDEQIIFTNELGSTFVCLSYNKPVQISERIVLTPPKRLFHTKNESTIIIKLLSGSSFGNGQHPTTCLILKQLDTLLLENQNHTIHKALDVGTGTGVLAIAAAKLGVPNIIATDRDRLAVYEANNNILINGLNDHIEVMCSDCIPDGHFQLILANLRYPTLCSIAEQFYQKLDIAGFCICSGFTGEEFDDLLETFDKNHFKCKNFMQKNKWFGATFIKQ